MATTQSHRQAIVTRWLGPTTHLPARIACRSDAGRTLHRWDYSLDVGANHAQAANAHAEKFGWTDANDYVGGGLYSESPDAYCFVAVEKAVQP